MLPRALRDVADRSGYTDVIERAGGRLLGDSCPAMSRVAPEGTRVFATDSAKQAHYLPAILGIEAWLRHPQGGLRRRRRHRPLAGEARVITLHGRTVVPGC